MKKTIALSLAILMALFGGCALTEPEEEIVEVVTVPAVTEAPVTEAPKEEPPIEVDRFCEPDDVPDYHLPEFDDESLGIEADGEVYTIGWLYEHNIYDWREAGITFEQIDERSEDILKLDYPTAVFNAFKQKISDFVELMMLSPADGASVKPGGIVVTTDAGGEVSEASYDFDWLSSHNATDYTAAGIDEHTVSQYLGSIHDDFWYTKEYRWIEVVHERLVNGW